MKKIFLISMIVISSPAWALSESSKAYLNHLRERLLKASSSKTADLQVLYSENGPSTGGAPGERFGNPSSGDPEFFGDNVRANPQITSDAPPPDPGFSVSDFAPDTSYRPKVKSKKQWKKNKKNLKKAKKHGKKGKKIKKSWKKAKKRARK